jgi:hypothetical protein
LYFFENLLPLCQSLKPRILLRSRPSVSKAIKRGEKFAKENDVKLLS